MNSSIEFKLIQQFRNLERAQNDLDFKRSEWCKSAREAAGTDSAFIRWCQIKLELTDHQANELLQRSTAASVVTDAKSWDQLGGFKGIAPVIELPKREQIAVVQAAKVDAKSIRTVMRERGHINPIIPAPLPAQEKKRISDVALLAKYIAEHCQGARLPSDVETIVLMYVPSFGKKRAA